MIPSTPHSARSILAGTLFALLSLSLASPALAGCGCDHPPPDFALVMPPFASPGKTLEIHADGFSFVPGTSYQVTFDGEVASEAVAESSDRLEIVFPGDVEPGPVSIHVAGGEVEHTYASSHFTALSAAPVVPTGDGSFVLRNFTLSITEDGTLLIPVNLSLVQDATQFAFQVGDLRLSFEHEDVVFYNEDGVDLTLFTLAVDDATQRQWGSYYGWTVDGDSGLHGEVFEHKSRKSRSKSSLSDMLAYWRHEFRTYNVAHLPGGTHEVGSDGFHLNLGTQHIDHDHLVVAISGLVRSAAHPDDPSYSQPLAPGSHKADLYVATRLSADPLEPEVLESALLEAAQSGVAFPMAVEQASEYEVGSE